MSETIPDFLGYPVRPFLPRELDWATCWLDAPPAIDTDVLLSSGEAVTVSIAAECRNLVVSSGATLRLWRGCRLRVGTLHVRPGGTLEVAAGAEVIFAGLPFGANDSEEVGNGLIVEGRLVVRGTPKTPFARLASCSVPGHVGLDVAGEVAGWNVGDRLALSASGERDYYHRLRLADRLRVREEEPGYPAMVLIDDTVRACHLAGWPADEKGTYLPHVANLTRDVVFRSENPGGIRGHFLATGHAEVDIEGAAFIDMGRTTDAPIGPANRKGRYAVHMHYLHGGPRPGREHRFRLVGCAVVDSRKWSIVVHNSHCGLVRDNVVVGARHAGIVTEDGSESFNTIEGNFVCDITNGHGFWLNGVNNRFLRNVACSCWGETAKPIVNEFGSEVGGYGFWLVSNTTCAVRKFTVPRPDGTTYTFTVGWQGILEFHGNECYTVRGGVYIDHRKGNIHVISNIRVWGSYGNVTHGIAVGAYDTAPVPGRGNGVWIEGLVSRGASVDCYSNNRTRVNDSDIRGCDVGIRDRMNSGILCVAACTLDNAVDVALVLPSNAGAGPLPLASTPLKEVRIVGNTFHGALHVRVDAMWDHNTRSRVPVSLTRMWLDGKRLYFHEQHAAAICPSILDIRPDPVFVSNGCPERGLSNAQAWAKYGMALGGEVAPADAVAVEKIHGLVARV